MTEDLFVACKDCGWCIMTKPASHMSHPPRYNCERKFYEQMDFGYAIVARRCRSFVSPEQAEEIRRIEGKAW